MKFNGTGGKWELYIRIDDYETYQYSVTSGNGKVAYCYNMSIADYENKIAKANALLISKAPEMLDMLQTLSNLMKEDVFLHDTSIKQWFYNTVIEVDELIKEATEL